MKAADRSGASHAVIVGDQELAEGVATVRPLRGDFGDDQVAVARVELAPHLTSVLQKEPS
jgi:histidyl-tRNA synthetase